MDIRDADVLDLSYLKNKKEDTLNQYRMQGLPVDELRTVLDALYDGVPETAFWLTQIRAFYSKKNNLFREHSVYLYLIKNQLTGRRLVEFFKNEEGFLNGMNFIINRMEGRKFTLERIKIDEAL